jgi:hypothetical protein
MRTLRDSLILVALVLGAHARDIWQLTGGREPQAASGGGDPAAHVILIVADGLRWQEVFRGADSVLLFSGPGVTGGNAAATHARYWRADRAARRAALMPFLWSTLAGDGMLLGNRDVGSAVDVTNPMKFSYPGYNELLVGYPDARIDRNDFGPNPNVTVFEWIDGRAGFRGRVDVVGTWTTFRDIFNAGRSRLPIATEDSDGATHQAALRRLRARRPAALFVGYGDTDDFAHKGRYDRTLDAAHAIDRYAEELWSAAQSVQEMRGRTTMILVADHGRGRTTESWRDHNKDVDGADETWFAIIGPGVGAGGEVRGGPRATLAQAAATVAAGLGLDYPGAVPRAAAALQHGKTPAALSAAGASLTR